MPMFFILNSVGAGLNDYIKKADNFNFINLILNKEIYLPIIFFIIVIIASSLIKKKIFNIKKPRLGSNSLNNTYAWNGRDIQDYGNRRNGK